ncbi:tryptophan--tRNA ligase [Candidatus Woesearchaeota archaeon]|nr:tryptophan--tRNA ligase [Candidatus Woesearchaeota archaeon]
MVHKFTVTPWEVKGKIDYSKLIKEFGLKPMEDLPPEFTSNLLFRRKKIFAHRDYGRIIDAIKHKKPFAMMTGLMPTGKFHIGHAVLAKQFLFYQEMGAKLYIAVADVEAYNARGQSLEESRRIAIDQYITSYIALGLRPENCEIYFQSERSSDSKKANAFYRLQNLLARHATFNEFKAVYGEISPGKMMCGILQAADMLHAQLPEFEGPVPVVVPVGPDQDPHIRLARDLASRIKEYKFTQLCSTYHLFVPGLNGDKMSASDPNSYIALTDDDKTVKTKVNKYAFSGGKDTVEEHRKHGGNPDVDVAYQWLTFFEEDDARLKQVHDDYKSGKLLSGEMKAILIEKLNSFLKSHQAKREEAKKRVREFLR